EGLRLAVTLLSKLLSQPGQEGVVVTGVVVKPQWVEISQFVGDADRVDVNQHRPRVERQFSRDRSSQCPRSSIVTREPHAAKLPKAGQDEVPGRGLPDGSEQWEGCRAVGFGKTFFDREGP